LGKNQNLASPKTFDLLRPLLACLHDQNKIDFLEGRLFVQSIRDF